MIALRDSTKTKLTAVLTADELQKLRDATAGHRMHRGHGPQPQGWRTQARLTAHDPVTNPGRFTASGFCCQQQLRIVREHTFLQTSWSNRGFFSVVERSNSHQGKPRYPTLSP